MVRDASSLNHGRKNLCTIPPIEFAPSALADLQQNSIVPYNYERERERERGENERERERAIERTIERASERASERARKRGNPAAERYCPMLFLHIYKSIYLYIYVLQHTRILFHLTTVYVQFKQVWGDCWLAALRVWLLDRMSQVSFGKRACLLVKEPCQNRTLFRNRPFVCVCVYVCVCARVCNNSEPTCPCRRLYRYLCLRLCLCRCLCLYLCLCLLINLLICVNICVHACTSTLLSFGTWSNSVHLRHVCKPSETCGLAIVNRYISQFHEH